jgi:fructose-bisphosphate aldolase class II
MQKVCADRYTQFEAAGQASKIKQVSIYDFVPKYAKGELTQVSRKAVAV